MEKPKMNLVAEARTSGFSPDGGESEQRNALIPDPSVDGSFSSPEMTRAYRIAGLVAVTDVPVLITGESGVGKEVFAQFIHKHSPRANHPMVQIGRAQSE